MAPRLRFRSIAVGVCAICAILFVGFLSCEDAYGTSFVRHVSSHATASVNRTTPKPVIQPCTKEVKNNVTFPNPTTLPVIVEDTQAARQETLRRECLRKNTSASRRLVEACGEFRVLPKQRTLLLLIPKCGGTNWGRLLLSIYGFKRQDAKVSAQETVNLLKKRFKFLKSISERVKKSYAAQYKKVIFVRNPYTRLLAAFRDRLEAYPNRNLYHRRTHNKKIYTKYGNHSKAEMPGPSVKSEMYNVTFKEFIDYFLAKNYDIHWEDVYKICNPCLGYDYIGRLEMYTEDVIEVLKLMGVDSKFYPYKALDVSNSSDDAIMKKYYDTLSDEQFEKVNQRLSADMAYFGYKMPESIRRH
ncbi:carbohydrate sulfotransferase 9-like [Diadema setosum]|uniref:carbohydrate sulfotransferase 9-like n=1 Tax=Diadema setosum TaxID=31175 RepID=UPI003B3A8042